MVIGDLDLEYLIGYFCLEFFKFCTGHHCCML